MLVHQFVVLVVKPGEALFNCESDFHSTVPVVTKFSVDHPQQNIVHHNRGRGPSVNRLLERVFGNYLAGLCQQRCCSYGQAPRRAMRLGWSLD